MKQTHNAYRYKTPIDKKKPHPRREVAHPRREVGIAANAGANSPPTEQRLRHETTIKGTYYSPTILETKKQEAGHRKLERRLQIAGQGLS